MIWDYINKIIGIAVFGIGCFFGYDVLILNGNAYSLLLFLTLPTLSIYWFLKHDNVHRKMIKESKMENNR